MTTTPPSAGPAEVRRYTPYVETVTHSDGVSNDSIWDEPRARMRPWMHGEWVLASDYDTLAARCASQERELAELRERESVIYDGHRVLTEVKANAKAAGRTSPENVSDVLDAIARIWKEPT
jgi:hypothetical protein